jgi:signal transduction histidine kinase
MIVRSALAALTRSPLRFLVSAWPWRSLVYLLASVVPGAAVSVVFLLGEFRLGLNVFLIGLLGLCLIPLVAPLVTRFERLRIRLVDTEPLAPPAGKPLLRRLREPQAWREIGYTLVALLGLWVIDLGMVALAIGIPGTLVTAPLQPSGPDPVLAWIIAVAGVLLLPVAAYPITAWAGARAAMTRALLSPREADLAQVLQSRARLVDAFESERRRIERDLHDGAQQRLVSLTMKLGLARLELPAGSQLAADLADAHNEAKLALSELRELIRGVHPQILSGRGLAAAVRDVAGRSPVPVDVDLDGQLDLPRLPEHVEVTAYFVVSEALANVAKHSHAQRCTVSGRLTSNVLRLDISDDGVGGADPAAGTGLTGLADRVAAVGGQLMISSPRGGPTLLRAELPGAELSAVQDGPGTFCGRAPHVAGG